MQFRRSFPVLLVLFAGCPRHERGAPVPLNRAEPVPWAPGLVVAPGQVPGWLGVAGPDLDAAGAAALVDVEAPPPGTPLRAVPSRGEAVTATVGERTTVHYGCDENTLDLVPVRAEAPLAEGPVLLFPTPLPDGWAPAAVPLEPTDRARDRLAWTAGPIELSLARTDELRARFRIRAGERVLHDSLEGLYFMEGADPHPLDLTDDFLPGIPTPRAVFLLAPDGPALVVLETRGYEGTTLHALLVGADRAEAVESMSVYLYWCAF